MKIQRKKFSFEEIAFTFRISKLFPVDRYNCFSSNRDTTIDDKHLKIIPQWRLRHVIEKKTVSLQKYLNRFDLHIVETLKKNSINQGQMLKRVAKFAKLAKSEIRYVEFNKVTPFDGMMEWRNALLYKTKVGIAMK